MAYKFVFDVADNLEKTKLQPKLKLSTVKRGFINNPQPHREISIEIYSFFMVNTKNINPDRKYRNAKRHT